MLPNILRSFILLILSVGIIRGSPPPQHSHYSMRREKSQEMLKYMNTTLDPCDDFFEYNCANFGKYYADVLPQMGNVGTMELMYKEMSGKIKLELQADNVDDRLGDRKVKNLYRSCLKASELTDAYRNKLKQLIGEFGKMPVLEGDNWRESDFDWSSIVAEMNYKMHIGIIFAIEVGADMVDPSILRSGFTSPIFPLKLKALYVNEQFKGQLQTHKHYIAQDLYDFLGVEKQLALQTAEEILNFEIDLAQGLMDPQTTTPVTDIYVLTATEELQSKYLPLWDTKKLMNSGLGYVPAQVVAELPYLENAFAVIQKTPKRVVANYILFMYIRKFFKNFSENLAVQEANCIHLTKEHFIKNLENMMFRKYFTEHDKQSLYVMWNEFKSSFEEVLKSPRVSWMSEETRKEALAKVKNIKFQINAYETEDFDRQLLAVDVDEFDYIQNIHSLLILQGNEARAKMNQPPTIETDHLKLSTTPVYMPRENTVNIPVYFLQPYRLFSNSYPEAFNFAAVGFIIAHELIHGFDDIGSGYDAYGKLRNWWDPQSAGALQDRTRCLMDQYKKYTFGGHPLREIKKQSENMADNGGIRLAYQAYLRWYERASEIKQKMEWFPAMDYTYKQLFFVSFAQSLCAATDPSHAERMVQTDTHSPDKLRVIGSLSNFEEFAKEFNCPRGSGMNPIHKCEIY